MGRLSRLAALALAFGLALPAGAAERALPRIGLQAGLGQAVVPVTIEPATKKDVSAVHAIEVAAFPNEAYPREYFSAAVRGESEIQVLREGGKPAAYVNYGNVDDETHVISLATHPDHWKKGHAEALMRRVIEEARVSAEINFVTLHVRVGNAPAQHLYRKLGFAPVALVDGYYQDGEDALHMSLPVDGPR